MSDSTSSKNDSDKRGILKRGCCVFGIILLSALVIYLSLLVGSSIFGSKCGMGSDYSAKVPCGKIIISNSNLTSSGELTMVSNYSNNDNSTNSTNLTESYFERVGRCNLYYGSNYNDMYALCTNNDETQIYDYECDVEQILNTSCVEWQAKGLMYFAVFLLGLCLFMSLLAAWTYLIASPIVLCYKIIDHNFPNKLGKGILIFATIMVYVFTAVAFVELYPYIMNDKRNYPQYKDEFKCNVVQRCFNDASNCIDSDQYCYMIDPMEMITIASFVLVACQGIVYVCYLIIFGLYGLGGWIIFGKN